MQPVAEQEVVAYLEVSILTRPGGRVQRYRLEQWHAETGFNPHPSRRTGATREEERERWRAYSFNPHPSRRTGATWTEMQQKP